MLQMAFLRTSLKTPGQVRCLTGHCATLQNGAYTHIHPVKDCLGCEEVTFRILRWDSLMLPFTLSLISSDFYKSLEHFWFDVGATEWYWGISSQCRVWSSFTTDELGLFKGCNGENILILIRRRHSSIIAK